MTTITPFPCAKCGAPRVGASDLCHAHGGSMEAKHTPKCRVPGHRCQTDCIPDIETNRAGLLEQHERDSRTLAEYAKEKNQLREEVRELKRTNAAFLEAAKKANALLAGSKGPIKQMLEKAIAQAEGGQMSEIKDGGDAFPSDHYHLKGGLTKREWFAGMAMSHLVNDWQREEPWFTAAKIAEMSYAIADAMLKEGAK